MLLELELMRADNEWALAGHIVVSCGNYFDPSRFANNRPGSADFLGQATRHRRSILKCPSPLVAGGIFGRSGLAIDRVGLICVDYQPH